jgi:hypothetical protein
VPAVTARGAIVEKGRGRRKVIGDYLNSHRYNKNNVAASLIAKVVNDNAGKLIPRGDLELFASKLAPTIGCVWIRFFW